VLVVPGLVGQVLDECGRAGVVHGHELHAQADAECRQLPPPVKGRQQRELKGLTARVHDLGLGMQLSVHGTYINIVTAGEHQTAQTIEVVVDEFNLWREQQRNAPGSDDRVLIGDR